MTQKARHADFPADAKAVSPRRNAPHGCCADRCTARRCRVLGELQTDWEDYTEARLHLEAALAGFERLFCQEHPPYSLCRISLAALDRNTGDYATATVRMEQSLAALRKSLGPHSLPVLKGTCDLARSIALQGDESRARRLLRETVDAAHHTSGRQSHFTAKILRWVASRYEFWGDWDQARKLLEELLEIARETEGNSRLQEARTMHDLGAILLRAGDDTAGRRYLEEALTISREHLGTQHAELATLIHDVGVALACMSSQDSARIYLEESLAVRRALFGSDELGALATTNALLAVARIRWVCEGPQAALPNYCLALEWTRRMRGPETLETAECLLKLGALQAELRQFAEAERTFHQAENLLEKNRGIHHPQTLRAFQQAANALAADFPRAQFHFQNGFHRELLEALMNMAESQPRLTDGRYCIERFQVNYLESGRDLIPRLRPGGRAGLSVILADPDYDVLSEFSEQSTPSSLSQNRRRSSPLCGESRMKKLKH